MNGQAVKGPDRLYRVRWWLHNLGCGDWKLGRYGWRRWEMSDGCLGSSGRTPWTALFRLLRLRKTSRDRVGPFLFEMVDA